MNFRVESPASLEEALTLLSNPEAVALAGGTDLVGVLKDRLHTAGPKTVVNIQRLDELKGVVIREDGDLALGALTTLTEIARHPAIVDKFPMLAQAALSVGSRQLRNLGTLGGNLCQETRCWYYRYPKSLGGPIPCLRKGAKGCPAVGGDNRNHSLFGGKGCFAVHPSDLATALVALDALLTLRSGETVREVPAAGFHGPLGTTLKPGELLTSIRIPALAAPNRQRYLKFTIRTPIDFAMAAVACILTLEGERVISASMALGGVAPTPLRATEVENLLLGSELSIDLARECAALAVKDAHPLSGNAHRVEILKTLVERALAGEETAREDNWQSIVREVSDAGSIYRWENGEHRCAMEKN